MEYRQTATSTARHALQLPDDDPESTSVDLLLEDKDYPTISVGIGQLIRRERHADVYSAYWRPDGVIVVISEARAFILEGVAAKLRRHRKRCMQRLKPRTLATTSLRGAEIIVYKTSSRAYIQDEDSVSNEPSPSLLFQKRTLNYKREPARIQPARPQRRKNAFDEQGLVAYIRALNAELNRDNISMAPDLLDAFRAAVLLYIFFDKKGNRRSAELPYVPKGCISSSKPTTLYFLLRSLSVLETPGLRPGERRSPPHGNDWMLYEMRQQLEDLKTQLFNMSYRELSMGVDSFLSTLSSSDLRSVQSRNHQFGLLQHIRITLPILIQSYPEIPHEYAFWWSSLPENKDVLYLLFLTILGTVLGPILIDYMSKYIF